MTTDVPTREQLVRRASELVRAVRAAWVVVEQDGQWQLAAYQNCPATPERPPQPHPWAGSATALAPARAHPPAV